MKTTKTVNRLATLIEGVKARYDEMRDTAETLYDEGWNDLADQVHDFLATGADSIDEIEIPDEALEAEAPWQTWHFEGTPEEGGTGWFYRLNIWADDENAIGPFADQSLAIVAAAKDALSHLTDDTDDTDARQ